MWSSGEPWGWGRHWGWHRARPTPLCPPCPPCRAAGAGRAHRSLRGVPEHRRAGGAAAQRAPDLRQPAAPLHRQVQPAGLPGLPTAGAAARPLLTSAPPPAGAASCTSARWWWTACSGRRPAPCGSRASALTTRDTRPHCSPEARPGPPQARLHQLCRARTTAHAHSCRGPAQRGRILGRDGAEAQGGEHRRRRQPRPQPPGRRPRLLRPRIPEGRPDHPGWLALAPQRA